MPELFFNPNISYGPYARLRVDYRNGQLWVAVGECNTPISPVALLPDEVRDLIAELLVELVKLENNRELAAEL